METGRGHLRGGLSGRRTRQNGSRVLSSREGVKVRVLVTGGTGFLGRHLVRRLRTDHDVYSLSRRPPGSPERGVTYIQGDIADPDPALFPPEMDVIIHQAALIDNHLAANPPLSALASANVVGTLRMLDLGARLGIRRFVYGSSGNAGGVPHPDVPDEPRPRITTEYYGLTKYLAEHALFGYNWPFEATSLRYFAPYAVDGPNPLFEYFVEMIDTGGEIEVGADGGQVISPIHISDAVELTVRAMEIDDPPTTVDVAGPERVTVARFAELLGSAMGKPVRIRHSEKRAASREADIDHLTATLGAPRVGVAEGINREWGTQAGG